MLEECLIYNELCDIPAEFIKVKRFFMHPYICLDFMCKVNALFFDNGGDIQRGKFPSNHKHLGKSWATFFMKTLLLRFRYVTTLA